MVYCESTIKTFLRNYRSFCGFEFFFIYVNKTRVYECNVRISVFHLLPYLYVSETFHAAKQPDRRETRALLPSVREQLRNVLGIVKAPI